MPSTLLRLSILPIVVVLGSCSYHYDLKAVIFGGRIAFIVDPSSDRHPDCISGIFVSADKGEPSAEPVPGDDEALVRNGGAYWWSFDDAGTCANSFPIFYGAKLEGPRSKNVGYVEPKLLKIGVVYEVNTSGSGGYGSGWFKVLPDGRVVNYQSDPTPQARDSNGYAIPSDQTKL